MTGDCSGFLSLSASAWPDSSYDRHAGKRTITGKVIWLSGGEKETLDFGSESCLPHYALRTELSNCFWTTSDARSGFLQAPWHHSHYRNIFRHQKVNGDWVWTTLAECGALRGGRKDNLFRQVRSTLLTLLVCIKQDIILAENSPGAALRISSNTHIGTVEIWKMSTFSPKKGTTLLFLLARTLLERLTTLLNKTEVFFDNSECAAFSNGIMWGETIKDKFSSLLYCTMFTSPRFRRKDVRICLISPCFLCLQTVDVRDDYHYSLKWWHMYTKITAMFTGSRT